MWYTNSKYAKKKNSEGEGSGGEEEEEGVNNQSFQTSFFSVPGH